MKSDCILKLVISFLQTKRGRYQVQSRNPSFIVGVVFTDSQVLYGLISAHQLLHVIQCTPARLCHNECDRRADTSLTQQQFM